MTRHMFALSMLCAFLLQPSQRAEAFVSVLPLDSQVAAADAVVIARPVKLTKLPTTTDRKVYEFGEFRIKRLLIDEEAYGVRLVNRKERTISVLRLWHGSDHAFQDYTKQDFDEDRDHILTLEATGVDGNYRSVESYQKLMPATEDAVKRVFEVMYGDENEPLAIEPMDVEEALIMAKAKLQRTAEGIDVIAQLDNDAFLKLKYDGADEERREVLESVFGPMKDNRRVISIVAEPENIYKGERRGSSGRISYRALARKKYTFGGMLKGTDTDTFGRKWKRLAEEPEMEAYTQPSSDFGRILVARRTVETDRGPYTIEVLIKIAGGAVGIQHTIDHRAEARKNKAAYDE